jgi:hypothetical protein
VESPRPLESLRHTPPLVDLIMGTLARDPELRPGVAELFDRFDELADRAGVGKVRFR